MTKFLCPHKNCGKSFNRKTNLTEHIRFSHSNKFTWLKCELCDYKTKRKGNLNLHLEKRHAMVSKIELKNNKKIKVFDGLLVLTYQEVENYFKYHNN